MADAPSPQGSGTTAGAPVIETGHVVAARGRPGGRPKRPEIDYDTNMRAARQSMKEATKAVAAARAVQKNEARKKQRLMKKASQLSSHDLERIAVMKRCGLFDPTTMMAVPRSSQSSASNSGTPEPTSVPLQPPRPEQQQEESNQKKKTGEGMDMSEEEQRGEQDELGVREGPDM